MILITKKSLIFVKGRDGTLSVGAIPGISRGSRHPLGTLSARKRYLLNYARLSWSNTYFRTEFHDQINGELMTSEWYWGRRGLWCKPADVRWIMEVIPNYKGGTARNHYIDKLVIFTERMLESVATCALLEDGTGGKIAKKISSRNLMFDLTLHRGNHLSLSKFTCNFLRRILSERKSWECQNFICNIYQTY